MASSKNRVASTTSGTSSTPVARTPGQCRVAPIVAPVPTPEEERCSAPPCSSRGMCACLGSAKVVSSPSGVFCTPPMLNLLLTLRNFSPCLFSTTATVPSTPSVRQRVRPPAGGSTRARSAVSATAASAIGSENAGITFDLSEGMSSRYPPAMMSSAAFAPMIG